MPILPLQATLKDFAGYLNTMSSNINTVTVKVLDAHGRIAKRISTDVNDGAQILKATMTDLAEGTYVLNAFNGDTFLKAIRFIKD